MFDGYLLFCFFGKDGEIVENYFVFDDVFIFGLLDVFFKVDDEMISDMVICFRECWLYKILDLVEFGVDLGI